jgi:hypothetical protein
MFPFHGMTAADVFWPEINFLSQCNLPITLKKFLENMVAEAFLWQLLFL